MCVCVYVCPLHAPEMKVETSALVGRVGSSDPSSSPLPPSPALPSAPLLSPPNIMATGSCTRELARARYTCAVWQQSGGARKGKASPTAPTSSRGESALSSASLCATLAPSCMSCPSAEDRAPSSPCRDGVAVAACDASFAGEGGAVAVPCSPPPVPAAPSREARRSPWRSLCSRCCTRSAIGSRCPASRPGSAARAPSSHAPSSPSSPLSGSCSRPAPSTAGRDGGAGTSSPSIPSSSSSPWSTLSAPSPPAEPGPSCAPSALDPASSCPPPPPLPRCSVLAASRLSRC